MRLERWSLKPTRRLQTTNGTWVKSSDAEELELAVERATANMVAAQNRAAELEKALNEKDIEIESLRIVLSDCLDHFEHTPTRPIAVAVRKILGGGG
jgi:multidrug resistance efflux pump